MGKWNASKKMCECDPQTQELKEEICQNKSISATNTGTTGTQFNLGHATWANNKKKNQQQ